MFTRMKGVSVSLTRTKRQECIYFPHFCSTPELISLSSWCLQAVLVLVSATKRRKVEEKGESE